MQALHDKYSKQGLAVVGFPCNQFNNQEPGTAKDIRTFCTDSYSVTFDMFAKIEVNGSGAHPLYRKLKSDAPGLLGSEGIKWNFTKFLVDRDGKVVKRYGSVDKPESIAADVEKLLG